MAQEMNQGRVAEGDVFSRHGSRMQSEFPLHQVKSWRGSWGAPHSARVAGRSTAVKPWSLGGSARPGPSRVALAKGVSRRGTPSIDVPCSRCACGHILAAVGPPGVCTLMSPDIFRSMGGGVKAHLTFHQAFASFPAPRVRFLWNVRQLLVRFS